VTVVAQLPPEAKAALVRQHLDDGVPLTRLAADAGLPARTLRRWAASYRTTQTTAALQQARTARRKQLKQQLRDRRSLADALPDDQRHLPPEPAPEPAPAPLPADATADLLQEPVVVPSVLAAPPAPAHRLRTYATD